MSNVKTILSAVGNTPLLELRHVVSSGYARVLLKLESENPTGSMKDRMARSVVERAAESGRLGPCGRVVEYTGGSTGTSLAFVCAALGYRISIVTSDAFSREKRDHMRALGADVEEIPSRGEGITEELIRSMMTRAAQIGEAPEAFFADQFNNPDVAAGYTPLADEIWSETQGAVDAFVLSVGTAQCITGVGDGLRRRSSTIEVYAVEPEESSVLTGGPSGAHRIEGIGPGFVPPRWHEQLANEVLSVSSAEAMAMSRRLAREEAVFAGTSTGANVVAALRVAERLGSGGTVVTLACDSGLKYLSTELYSSAP